MTPTEIELVQQTFARLAPISDKAGRLKAEYDRNTKLMQFAVCGLLGAVLVILWAVGYIPECIGTHCG
jgi:hypothetical protein